MYCFYHSGTLELPLNKMPKPAKKSDKCTLDMLPDIEHGRTDVKSVSLFEQKRVRGFWPCFNDEKGERELTVSPSNIYCNEVMFAVIV